MKNIFALLASLVFFTSTAFACDGPYLIKYGTTNVWDFNLYEPDGSDFKTNITFDDDDISYTKNSGTVTAYPGSNITLITPQYKLTLDPTVTATARLHVQIREDGNFFPKCVNFWTYGNTLAQYQFDFNVGSEGTTLASNPLGKIGLAQAVTTNSITLAGSENFATNSLAANNVVFIAAASSGKYQTQCICSNSQSTDKVTLCQNWATVPTGSVYYMILPSYHCSTN